MTPRAALVCLLLASPAALAQADLPDAGLPDASIGGTGAERSSEEEEDGLDTPCLGDADCDHGFACQGGKCTYRRYRDATFAGCGLGPTLPVLALVTLWGLRRRARAGRPTSW